MSLRCLPALLLLPVVLASSPARSETVQTCTGFIDSLPATIGTQGIWCFRADLATAIGTGNAIDITTNNVTLDCNGFKLGGLGAGIATDARGIHANGRLNVTIRNCLVRGFRYGILLSGEGGGHVVEDNRTDGITQFAVSVVGDGSVIQRNRLNDTGGTPHANFSYGIYSAGQVDVIDNTIDVVVAGTSDGNGPAAGIQATNGAGNLISGNRVRGVQGSGSGAATSISAFTSMGRTNVRDNHVVGNGTAITVGIRCSPLGSASRNFIADHNTNLATCSNDGGNLLK